MNKITNQFASIEQVTDRYLNRKSTETAAQENSVSFEDILRQKQTTAESQELRFSKHAQGRLNDRTHNLSDRAERETEFRCFEGKRKGNTGITRDSGFTGVYCECSEQDGGHSHGSE